MEEMVEITAKDIALVNTQPTETYFFPFLNYNTNGLIKQCYDKRAAGLGQAQLL